MIIATLSESPADEAAVSILTVALLQSEVTIVSGPELTTRGWPSVRAVLPAVLKHLHYHTDAEALIVVVDSNHSPLHEPTEDPASPCRLCDIRQIAARTLQQVRPVQNRNPLKFAAGLAVPAVEAWYLSGLDPHVSEAEWSRGLREKRFPYTKLQLKEKVYGTDRPDLKLETRRAIEEAKRLAQDLASLRTFFPLGFGGLASDIEGWRTIKP